MKRPSKSRKALVCLLAVMGCILMADTNLQQSVMRQLMDNDIPEEREELTEDEFIRGLITVDMGSGKCDIGHPTADAPGAPDNAVKTVLASYPGSGKRFTWTVIKALTNMEVADDWNFSAKLDKKPLTIKTSWPHKEGVWSWGKEMDQVMLLIRSPRWAIPSYHTMRYELDYAQNWESSYLRIPDTYKERPKVPQWEAWRDEHFNVEMNRWVNYIDFWMQGGVERGTSEAHFRCLYSGLDCHPRAVIDFDHLYQENPTNEFVKITDVLEGSANVEIIAAQARVCVLDAVYDRKDLHQGQRPFPNRPPQYRFTISQMDKMLNRTIELRNKYADSSYNSNDVAKDLVKILDGYIDDIEAENSIESAILLDDFVAAFFEGLTCSTMEGIEQSVCNFMKARTNHDVFLTETNRDNFPYRQWLEERTILVELFYTNFPPGSSWLSEADHCSWEGITCFKNKVTDIDLTEKSLTGPYPSNLNNLNELISLDLSGNSLTGSIPDNICDLSMEGALSLTGDSTNCSNEFNATSTEYLPGCCGDVVG